MVAENGKFFTLAFTLDNASHWLHDTGTQNNNTISYLKSGLDAGKPCVAHDEFNAYRMRIVSKLFIPLFSCTIKKFPKTTSRNLTCS